ncbi:MAG: ATP-binding protein, partial [Myxococcota bacterium]
MDGNSRHPYSALIDALPIAAGLVDARGALVAANHAWATSGAPCSVAQPTEGAGYVGRLKQSSADGAAEVGAAITDALHAGQRPERITMADPDVPEDTTAAYIEVSVPGGSASAPIWRTRVAPAGDGLVLITHEDVSRSRQAQADLRKSRARLRTILTGAPLALFAVDTEGRFSLVEGMAAGAAGLITPEVVGRRVEEEYRHIPELVATVATALDGSTAVATVEVGALAFEVHCSPDIGGNGEFRGAVGIATDVTERVRAQRLKDDFVSVVNHELRTPLTSIHGALSLLENNVAGELPPEAVELTKIARTSVDRLIRMITDLLDLDRLDSGRFDLSRSRFDLGALAGDAVRELSALATDAEVEIETTACLSAFVEADRDRVHQVLTNLLSNAIKFSPVGGRVVVSMERRDGFLRVGVRDHGPGIRPEDRPRLFRKFSQLADPQSGSRRGSGLGLVISKSIVEAHGGRMTLESVVGEGSTFSFDLPVARV